MPDTTNDAISISASPVHPPAPLDLHSPICIIGTGISGLITAHVLLRDGFTSVTLVSRDTSVGGTWARQRVYEGLFTNNVHGEYRYSALPMPTPPLATETGGLLSGATLTDYFEAFSAQFLGGPQSASSTSYPYYQDPLSLNSSHGTHPYATNSKDGFSTKDGGPNTEDRPSKRTDDTEPKAHFLMRTEVLNVRRVAPGDWRVTVRNATPPKSDSQFSSQDSHHNESEDRPGGEEHILHFARIVLASGGNSTPHIPPALSSRAAHAAGFLQKSKTLVCHSSQIAAQLPAILSLVPATSPSGDGEAEIVVVGGGKSAQDICTLLAKENRKVAMVYSTTDAFLASPKPLPDFIRKSRLLSVLTPYPIIRSDNCTFTSTMPSRLERFLHGTTLGSALVHKFWKLLQNAAHNSLNIPSTSPLCASHSLFWSIRVSNLGAARPDNFTAAALKPASEGGNITTMFPRRVVGYYSESGMHGEDDGGHKSGLVLDDGTKLRARIVVLATGYKSSWAPILSRETQATIGLTAYPLPASTAVKLRAPWEELKVLQAGHPYRSGATVYTDNIESDVADSSLISNLASSPNAILGSATSNDSAMDGTGSGMREGEEEDRNQQQPMWVKAIYRGLVPAKNILNRDFAIAGTLLSGNMTYSNEVAAHWISSYFREDRMHLPVTITEAVAHAEARAVWMQMRFPEALRWANESACTSADLFTWPQLADEMLADMYLPGMRSGGSWYNWIFKTVDLKEIENLTEERRRNVIV